MGVAAKSNEDKLKILLEWKRLYIETIIDFLKPSGNVLEIGFGIGLAAERIQKHHPKTHIIIESNPQVLNEAKKWADKNSNTTVLQGKWETLLPTLGTFDAIFFNDYPIESDVDIMNFLFPEDTLQTSSQAKELLNMLEEEMSLLNAQFSDKDIEDFYKKVGQLNLKEMPKFFLKLKDNGNISKTQYENSVKKYHLNELEIQKNKDLDITKKPDTMLLFLEECLKNHMSKGSRFSSFLNNQTSKYEDSKFFDNIITNTDIDYKEACTPIKMSDKIREALIILVEKSL